MAVAYLEKLNSEQRPLVDGTLRIVARGEKEDKGGLTV
jgi:hypothetical protein